MGLVPLKPPLSGFVDERLQPLCHRVTAPITCGYRLSPGRGLVDERDATLLGVGVLGHDGNGLVGFWGSSTRAL